MKRFFYIALSVIVWIAIAAYLVWAARLGFERERDLLASGVEVIVEDSATMGVITPLMVQGWIAKEKLIDQNMAAREIPIVKIEQLVRSRGFVKDASVWVDLNGKTHITLRQRKPVMRVNTATGYDIYITDDGYVLPAQAHAAMWLPVVTGNYAPGFARNYVGSLDDAQKNMDENSVFLHKLIKFVEFLSKDDFWGAYVEQINLVASGPGGRDVDVEIVPRVGDHVVMLGDLDDFQAKLSKLRVFYDKVIPYEGWDAYKYVNLKYKNQIVCTK